MLILIKGTHVAILMACPILILYYISDNFSLKTLLPILFFGGFVVVTQFCFPAPYEQGHLDSMLAAMRSSGLREMSGILIYFLIQIIRFNYVLPLILFTGSLALLFRNKKYLIGFATALYSALFFALILYKLIPYNAEYPLSSDVEFYIQGAFYSLFLMFAANFFYLIQKQNESIMKRTTVKALTIFAIIFFSSQISYAGVKLWEYNRYTNALMSDLSNKYPESIFIIGDQFIPNRFSKINMNVEFETMINSTLYTGIPTALFITPYPKPFKYENGDPLYINSVSQLEKSKEIPTDQSAAHHFKMFYPSRYFEKCNAHYFPFKNFDHRIVNSEYMETFNNEYGFAISEF
jgi:hypothetical protein